MAKAQVGDLIRITNKDDKQYAEFNNGDILEVKKRASNDSGVLVDGHGAVIVFDEEYEIHRKAGEEAERDAVNPQHYKQGRTEVIDIIEDAVVGADPFEAVCQANVLKYTLRYRHKNGVEDLKKAVWYAEKLIAHITQ